MLTTEAKQTLLRIAKAMRPATPPWNTDDSVLDEWVNATIARNMEANDIRQLFDKWTAEGNTRWPSLYQFRQMARRRPNKQTFTSNTSCLVCHGSGWSYQHDTDGTEQTMERNGHHYTYVTPCNCIAGQHAQQTELYKELCNAKQ